LNCFLLFIIIDYIAVIVLHANESRLVINQQEGIGLGKLFRALQLHSNNHVLVVIAHDARNKYNEGPIISPTIYYKIRSQFSDEQLNGKEGFVFSWNTIPTTEHKEAFSHYITNFRAQKRESYISNISEYVLGIEENNKRDESTRSSLNIMQQGDDDTWWEAVRTSEGVSWIEKPDISEEEESFLLTLIGEWKENVRFRVRMKGGLVKEVKPLNWYANCKLL